MAVARGYLSLDAPVGDGDETKLLEFLPDDDGRTTDEDAVEHGLAETMDDALAHLRGREAMVLRLYFGFDGHEPMTLEEIGGRLGVTRERVRQLKEKGLSRLRRSREAAVLAPFYER